LVHYIIVPLTLFLVHLDIDSWFGSLLPSRNLSTVSGQTLLNYTDHDNK